MVKASVILPTHNRAYILKYCLRNILNQTVNTYEVIVVDDASDDETPKLISNFKMQNAKLRYIQLKKQNGPYAARNIGIKNSDAEIIIFIDSDVLVGPRFVADHIQIHEKNRKIILQGMVRHTRNPETAGKYLIFPSIFFGLLVTQNASVRKEWLEHAGLFDESLGALIGFKDIEMGLRLKKLGLKFVHAIRRCKAYHIDSSYGKGRLDEYIQKHLERGRSAYFFVKKHGAPAEKIAKTRRILFISRFFETQKWAEKESTVKFLKQIVDSPILFLFPMWRSLVKYHYRAKGIREAMAQNENICDHTNI